jgi:hypothetical protein
VLSLAVAPGGAIEIEYDGGNSFTVTGYTIPEAPGAGAGKAAREIVPMAHATVIQNLEDMGIVTTTVRTYRTIEPSIQVTLPSGRENVTVVAVDGLEGLAIRTRFSFSKTADDVPFGLQGFEEGSGELTISGLPVGASIVTSYVSPGRGSMISWLEDGSWGDDDGEANGTIVTFPPRWSGPPYVLGGEHLTIGLDGGEETGLWTYESTGLGARYTVPVASHVIGASGNPFISDLTIANAFGVTADGWVRFIEDGADWQQAPSVDFTVAPGESLTWTDVLQTAFDITRNTKGTLVVGGVPTWSLAVVSKNYVVDENGKRFGIAIPGVSSFHPHTVQNFWVLPGVRQNGGFRSNLILAGAVPYQSTVSIRLLADGLVLADEFERSVPPYGLLQINRIAQAMGVSEVDDAHLEITVVEGAVYAAVSVVDNSADDAAYQTAVPALEVN